MNRDEVLDHLGEAGGEGIRVAIVDTGVQADHPWLGGKLSEAYGVRLDAAGEVEIGDFSVEDLVGHGTAVAGQIRRFAPEAELISIRILDEQRSSTSNALLAALRWLNHQKVHLVNFSLSTMNPGMALEMCHAVDDLNANHITCINSRGYHQNGRDYPTTFSGVIGVSFAEMHEAGLKLRPGDLVEFDGPGVDLKVAWVGGGTRTVTGSSYATPLVSGLAARMLSLKPDLTPYEIKSLLRDYALRHEAGWSEQWMQSVAKIPA